MAAGDTTQGRRVEPGFENLERPGDYYFADGILWAILPHGGHGRLPAIGCSETGGPEWTITADADGTVTVAPSIRQLPIESLGDPGWHGYLEHGVWREV